METTKNKIFFAIIVMILVSSISISVSIFPLQVLTIFIGAMLLIYTILRPYKVFVFIAAYIPFEYTINSFIPESYQNLFGLIPESILFLILIRIAFKKDRRKIKFTTIDFTLVVVTLLGITISIHNKISMFYVINGIRVLFRYISVFYICRMLKKPTDFLRKEIGTFRNILIVEIFIGIIQACLKKVGMLDIKYINGSIARYDQYATFLAIVCIFIYSKYFISKKKNKLDLLLICIACALILISTSRQGFIFLIVGILMIILSNSKNINIKRKLKYVMIFISSAILLMFLYYLITNTNSLLNEGSGRNAFKSIFSLFQAETYVVDINKNFRLYFIFGVGSFLIKNYFWGMGWGTFGATYSVDYELVNNVYRILDVDDSFRINFIADVNWITLVGQIGIIGSILFCISLLLIAYKSYKSVKKTTDIYSRIIFSACIGIIVPMIIVAFLGPHFEIRTSSFYMWLIAGLAINCGSQYKLNSQ